MGAPFKVLNQILFIPVLLREKHFFQKHFGYFSLLHILNKGKKDPMYLAIYQCKCFLKKSLNYLTTSYLRKFYKKEEKGLHP